MAADKKTKVALFLKAKVARELKIQVAMAGAKGVSEYVTTLVQKAKRPGDEPGR